MPPLEGLKVIDLTTMVSGPVAGMMLADQGAEVIKIEPLKGETMRHVRPPLNGVNPMFFSCNRGKRSLPLDLKAQEGRDILWKLIEQADVLIQNFRPGAMDRMGFSEEAMMKLNEKLIYVSISGFGDKGPYAQKRVYDPVIQALSGAADIQSIRETGEPRMFRLIIADKITSVTTAQAISTALYAREKNGKGQHIKISMLDCLLSLFWPEAMSGLTYEQMDVDPNRSLAAMDPIFKTRDRWITACAVADVEWQGLCRALGRPELAEDDRFRTTLARYENAEERRDLMAEEIAKWSSEELMARMDAEGVPCAPALTRDELLDHEQILANDSIQRITLEGFGEVRQAKPAAEFSGTPTAPFTPAPKLGEDTRDILGELGFTPDDIDDLLGRNVTLEVKE
ncbi:CaiB/BaiF CoA transferase family protein [Sneathiella chinensis]|uniref:CoA transferase n=1 Tax=Sneathiella chinensis TaxID=349750 RepID=A0ABQ5TYW8_9PROT|nr:CoA transferase [Sneathiella chinensis]GLQ05047.1 CoA transferase [Sneathiella chinensis]